MTRKTEDWSETDADGGREVRPVDAVDDDRRRVLKKAGVVGGMLAIAGIGAGAGLSAAQDGSNTIELDGETSGWVGRAPGSIAGTTNPTLSLTPGQEYTIRWTNIDGAPHNVVIQNSGGDSLVRSDIISEQGQTQTVTFTATEEMTEYYCEVHPTSMRGSVSLSSGSGGGMANATNGSADNGTRDANNENESEIEAPEGGPFANESANRSAPTPEVQPEWPPEKTWVLTIKDGKFVGQKPESIAGETNPTLHVEAGTTYGIRVTGPDRGDGNAPYDITGQRPNLVIRQDEYPIADSPFVKGPGNSEDEAFVMTGGSGSYLATDYLHARGDIEVNGSVESSNATSGATTTSNATKAENGNGKAKSGNGKAKTGSGNQMG